MIWVGGGIIIHSLEAYGVHSIGRAINSAAEAAAHMLPSAARPAEWAVTAFLSGVVGLLAGAVSIPAIGFAIAPGWKLMKSSWSKQG
jgi:predicted DNA repair protein MutK